MVNNRRFLIAAIVIASFNQAAFAQHRDFSPNVQMIFDYLKDSRETCIRGRTFRARRRSKHVVKARSLGHSSARR